MSMGGLSG